MSNTMCLYPGEGGGGSIVFSLPGLMKAAQVKQPRYVPLMSGSKIRDRWSILIKSLTRYK